MLYLVGQIILCLLFTLVIGITVGWLLRGLGTSRQTESLEAGWRARLAELESQLNHLRTADPAMAGDAAEIGQLRQQLAQRDAALETLKTGLAGAESARGKSGATRAEQENLQVKVAGLQATTDDYRQQVEQGARDKELLIQRLRERESEIGRMSQERQHAINTIATLQKEMRSLRGAQLRLEQAQRRDDAPEEPVTVSSAAGTTPETPAATPDADTPMRPKAPAPRPAPAPQSVAPAAGHTAPVVTGDRTPASENDTANTTSSPQQDLPMATPTPPPRRPYEPDWRLDQPRGQQDNLQAIYGIGPKLEQQLNALGVFHFDQIAAFGKDDILWVARHLKSFPGRIVRDRWIEQAATLARQRRG